MKLVLSTLLTIAFASSALAARTSRSSEVNYICTNSDGYQAELSLSNEDVAYLNSNPKKATIRTDRVFVRYIPSTTDLYLLVKAGTAEDGTYRCKQ